MAQPSSGSPDSGSSPSEPLIDRTLDHVDRLLPLALVPLATALLNVDELLATTEAGGLSIHGSFPIYRYDLWSFVGSPGDGGLSASVPFGTLDSPALIVPLLGAYVLVSGTLSAGYFGSIADGITTGRFDFAANVRRYAGRMIALEALTVVALLLVFLPLVAVPPLFVVAIVAVLVLGYLFFPTVYVVVLEDRGIESAARRAHGLVTRHRPLKFFLAIVVATACCSVPLSLMAYTGPISAVVTAIVAAPLGLAFNVVTALKVAEMADVDVVR